MRILLIQERIRFTKSDGRISVRGWLGVLGCRAAGTLPEAECLSRVEQSFSASIGDGRPSSVRPMRCREKIND